MSSAVSSLTGWDSTSAADTSNRVATKTLSQTDFLKVMVAQLAQQDPFKAADSSKFMEDFMTMGNFQAMQDVSSNMSKLYGQNQNLYAKDLVGAKVQISDDDGNLTTGIVESAHVETVDSTTNTSLGSSKTTKVIVTINGVDYDAANITKILQTSSETQTQTQTQT